MAVACGSPGGRRRSCGGRAARTRLVVSVVAAVAAVIAVCVRGAAAGGNREETTTTTPWTTPCGELADATPTDPAEDDEEAATASITTGSPATMEATEDDGTLPTDTPGPPLLPTSGSEEEITDRPRRPCCSSVENPVSFRSGDRDEFSVDIGRCRTVCHKPPGDDEAEEPAAGYAEDHDGGQQDACREDELCIPNLERLQRLHWTYGIREMPVIESCHCFNVSTPCGRTDRMMRFFPDTPFEALIDIGRCSGMCLENLECHSTRNTTLHIDGPNGSYGINVTSSCGCLGKCYRMDKYDYVYDHQTSEDGKNITKLIEVNIGECVGSCAKKEAHHCVLRNPKNPEECLMSLKRTTSCSPKGFTRQYHTNGNGVWVHVLAVDACECL